MNKDYGLRTSLRNDDAFLTSRCYLIKSVVAINLLGATGTLTARDLRVRESDTVHNINRLLDKAISIVGYETVVASIKLAELQLMRERDKDLFSSLRIEVGFLETISGQVLGTVQGGNLQGTISRYSHEIGYVYDSLAVKVYGKYKSVSDEEYPFPTDYLLNGPSYHPNFHITDGRWLDMF